MDMQNPKTMTKTITAAKTKITGNPAIIHAVPHLTSLVEVQVLKNVTSATPRIMLQPMDPRVVSWCNTSHARNSLRSIHRRDSHY